MKNKWKLFAIGHYFSNSLDEATAIKFFDSIAAAPPERIKWILTTNPDADLWPEYLGVSSKILQDDIQSLAENAQAFEEISL